MPDDTIGCNAGGDVPSVSGLEGWKIGKESVRLPKGQRTSGPIQRARQLADRRLTTLLQRKNLRQNGLVLLNGLDEDLRMGPGLGEYQVKDLLACALCSDLVNQARLCFVGPRPRADFLQAGFININDDEATLIIVQSPKTPNEVCTALLQLIKEGGCKMDKRSTNERSQTYPPCGNSVSTTAMKPRPEQSPPPQGQAAQCASGVLFFKDVASLFAVQAGGTSHPSIASCGQKHAVHSDRTG